MRISSFAHLIKTIIFGHSFYYIFERKDLSEIMINKNEIDKINGSSRDSMLTSY